MGLKLILLKRPQWVQLLLSKKRTGGASEFLPDEASLRYRRRAEQAKNQDQPGGRRGRRKLRKKKRNTGSKGKS